MDRSCFLEYNLTVVSRRRFTIDFRIGVLRMKKIIWTKKDQIKQIEILGVATSKMI